MRLFLAATSSKPFLKDDVSQCRYVLESFYYFKEWQIPLIKNSKDFLLDSGAFTFMNSSKGSVVDWDSYVDRYIEFININDIKHFFELDIDVIVGYEKVKQIRKRIEARTGKQCIPVWHRNRGAEEYISLCNEYPYIAIGGFAIKDIKQNEYRSIPYLLDKANSRGTKVHGLGFTPPNVIEYPFYSVDSSSWGTGSRFASVYLFQNGRMNVLAKKSNKRLIDYKSLDRHNLKQWLKYQKYLDKE